jgi:hypothetical protein
VIRVAAAFAFAAVATAAGCGGTASLTTRDVSTCLADRGVETAPRGDTSSATEVLAFQVPGSPPAHGFLIFVDHAEEAQTLEQDIRKSARDAGSVAHTLREQNVIVHFFTTDAPTQSEQRPIRACLER